HGSQCGERDAPPTAALVALRRTRPPHRREQQDGIVEDEVDAGLTQPATLETSVVSDDAATTEKIGQYNQSACRNGAVEDHHGGALTVGKLHGAETVGSRLEPRRFHVESEETVPRKEPLETIERGEREPFEGRSTQASVPGRF